MKQLIFKNSEYRIFAVDDADMMALARFVAEENRKHHCKQIVMDMTEVESIYAEEKAYPNSYIYIAKDNADKVVGTIRTFKWDKKTTLPIEKMFGVNPIRCINESTECNYWHVGRFAIDSFSGIHTLTLFKQLMFLAVRHIVSDTNSFIQQNVKHK